MDRGEKKPAKVETREWTLQIICKNQRGAKFFYYFSSSTGNDRRRKRESEEPWVKSKECLFLCTFSLRAPGLWAQPQHIVEDQGD